MYCELWSSLDFVVMSSSWKSASWMISSLRVLLPYWCFSQLVVDVEGGRGMGEEPMWCTATTCSESDCIQQSIYYEWRYQCECVKNVKSATHFWVSLTLHIASLCVLMHRNQQSEIKKEIKRNKKQIQRRSHAFMLQREQQNKQRWNLARNETIKQCAANSDTGDFRTREECTNSMRDC